MGPWEWVEMGGGRGRVGAILRMPDRV